MPFKKCTIPIPMHSFLALYRIFLANKFAWFTQHWLMCQKVLDPADTYCLKVLQLCQSLFIHDDRTFEFAVKGFLNSPVGGHTLKGNQSCGQLTWFVGPVHCCSPLCGLCSSRSQVDASLYAVRHLITVSLEMSS